MSTNPNPANSILDTLGSFISDLSGQHDLTIELNDPCLGRESLVVSGKIYDESPKQKVCIAECCVKKFVEDGNPLQIAFNIRIKETYAFHDNFEANKIRNQKVWALVDSVNEPEFKERLNSALKQKLLDLNPC